ncbi:uncharacterized protein LOC124903401 [Homo sapiens]|uniref:uncharacterized protein LOC124903401 n=1 Tax=Homo sapiens TaxID=9606 RepID=UPI001FB0F563|nr:uncharacterized protein LOC124903401 [Homo sapiens]XP_047302300.1 uncharacterized protein LOC124903401 [Homo sapiens]
METPPPPSLPFQLLCIRQPRYLQGLLSHSRHLKTQQDQPLPFLLLFNLLNLKSMMKTFVMIHIHLMKARQGTSTEGCDLTDGAMVTQSEVFCYGSLNRPRHQ